MKRTIFASIVAIAAILALPAVASAAPPEQVPPEHAGPKNGPDHATGKAGERGSERAEAARERVLIVKACHAERGQSAATREAFRAEYGTNRNGANAFGVCVSSGMRAGAPDNAAELRELVAKIRSRKLAARTCAIERAEIGRQDFADKYGTNRNNHNAFGRCVSHTAKNGVNG